MGWLLRENSDEEFLQRLIGCLSNPTKMLSHILDATNQRATIYETLRNQGEDIVASLKEHLSKLMTALKHLSDEERNAFSRSFIVNFPTPTINRAVVEGYCIGAITHLSDDEIYRLVSSCPALHTFCNAFSNYAIRLFQANLQKLEGKAPSISSGKTSDFGDLLHAAYAPYVDFFRCDSSFGAILKNDKGISTRVMDKRSHLVSTLSHYCAT